MSRDSEADIRRVNQLRQQVKAAEAKAAEARVHYEQAQADLIKACEIARELHIDPDNRRAFDIWLNTEGEDISQVMENIAYVLTKTQEAMNVG